MVYYIFEDNPDEALAKSRELIDDYNAWVDNYRSLGYNGLGEKL